ncbi:MAG: hypothetical protein OEW64_08970 [Gammaproteobacteria bacterium]|nr:hypothetical protein [Gammaproteobacteria bacterium]MDH5304215.1 hypothetical protein [Gammaproteobacteria bacterium]MDH5322168.1 hypothetical protein [Gammaproteobacteria bacterium]
MHALFEKVRSLNLPAGDFAIFGSGPLLVRGIIHEVQDIDIICRGAAWRRAQELGELSYLADFDLYVVSLDNDRISLGCRWGIGCFDIDELIDSAEVISGLPFVRLNFVIDYKRIAARPKDLVHLDLADAWIGAKKMADTGQQSG